MEEKKKRKKISDEIYIKNEIHANRALSMGCLFSAIVIAFIWVFYLTGIFGVSNHILLLHNIV